LSGGSCLASGRFELAGLSFQSHRQIPLIQPPAREFGSVRRPVTTLIALRFSLTGPGVNLPLARVGPFEQTPRMPEIAKFLHNGATKVTPRIMRGVHKKLPFLKVEFAQINAPKFPHLVDQLEFLANVVEDFAEGAADELPFVTLASAVFALVYAHRQYDLIPDFVPEFGHADDSGVVRAVLIENERILQSYAASHGYDWNQITVNP